MTEKEPANLPESLCDLEAILYAAAGPVSTSRLVEVTGLKTEQVRQLCSALAMDYERRGAGIRLQFLGDSVQLMTAPEACAAVEAFLGLEQTQKLSRAALETLTVIAYRQPVSRPAVDEIRGVNSDYTVRSLLNRGLIEELGRAETPGRPILYGTTQDFLLYFGLSSIDDLPPFETDRIKADSQKEIHILKE